MIASKGYNPSIELQTTIRGKSKSAAALAVIDSGATGNLISEKLVEQHKIRKIPIPEKIDLINANETRSTITSRVNVTMTIGSNPQHKEEISLYVGDIGTHEILLGTDWLIKHNPTINWEEYSVKMNRCPEECRQPGLIISTKPKQQGKLWNRNIQTSTIPRWTEEEEEEETWNNLQSIMIARAIFHNKEEEMDVQDQDISKHITKRQKIRKAQEINNDMLSWSKIKWNHFQNQIKARSAKTGLAPKASNTSQKLAQQQKKIVKDIRQQVPERYHKYLKVFDEQEANRFPSSKPWDHAIEMKEGYTPKDCKIYPLSPVERTSLDEWISEQLEKKYIRPSKSPQASPFFFVGKKDGKLRPVQDYRYLNSQTIKNAYPIPLISETIDKLKGAKYFTKMDVRWGYNNIRIKEGDQWKAAFKTQRGLFEPTVMFFGLCNSPATFQSMMNHLFKDLINQEKVVVYMDDILIFTEDLESHRQVTEEVLKILQENDLFLKPEKCEFKKLKIEYLGLIIMHNNVQMDPVKVQGLMDWPIPKKVKDVQAFIGFANFYRRFIQGFSKIARPLTQLTRKDIEWEWSQEAQNAFDKLKRAFTTAPILVMPDPSKKMRIETDASVLRMDKGL